MDPIYPFTPWTHWSDRKALPGLAAPGVYAIAYSEPDIAGQTFTWQKEIIYFGVARSLKKRLMLFDNALLNGKAMHSGARSVFKDHEDYSKLIPTLYVSVLAIGDTPFQHSPECWKKNGDARRLEYYCISEYLQRYGALPHYNKPAG